MASKQSTILSDNLYQKISSLEHTRRRMDRLFSEKKIYRRDVEHVYEGIFLKAVTEFEAYIESLFMGILHNKYKLTGRKKPARVVFDSKQIAYDIVLGGNSYVDWMPYDKLKKRANIFFEKGEPFTILDPTERDTLTQIMAIRNAIAHNSSYSKKRFEESVIRGAAGLPTEHKSPAGFLRYVYRTGPNQTKFENYMLELVGIASKISSYS